MPDAGQSVKRELRTLLSVEIADEPQQSIRSSLAEGASASPRPFADS
jgi:hypothetical protein